jgi:hypothetical protein
MDTMNDTFTYAVVGIIAYILYGVIWRLWLSPVARFPGSKLAAVTFWYEFYYDVIKGGAYVYEIERMHAKYGTSSPFYQVESTSIDEAKQVRSFASTHMNCTSMTQTWNSCPNYIRPSAETWISSGGLPACSAITT